MCKAPWQPLSDVYFRPGMGAIAYDPGTLMAASLAASAVGGGFSAMSTLAGGGMAKAAGIAQRTEANYQAAQLNENASQEIAGAQRQAIDAAQRTRLAISTATARAGASGAAPDVGSAVGNTGQLAQRGSYQALMDMFNGQSKASGLENQAAGIRYTGAVDELEGEGKQKASYLAAGGELAGAAGSMASTYGRYAYPMRYGTYGGGL